MNQQTNNLPENVKVEKFGNVWELNELTQGEYGNTRNTLRTCKTKKECVESYFKFFSK